MKVLTNEPFVYKRARLGKWISLAGLVVLVGGMLASFFPRYFYISLICLIVGFTASNIGAYNLNYWGREPRPDQLLAKFLKGLDDRYKLYNYYFPTAHLLLGPFGLLVIKVKVQDGEIVCQGERWRQKFSWKRLLLAFSQEPLGNPARELREEIGAVRKFLSRHLSDIEAPVKGAVLFIHPKASLTLTNPTVPVFKPKEFKTFVRRLSKESVMPSKERKALAAFLDEAAQPGG